MELQEKWFSLIRESEQSELSQRDFCAEHHVKFSTFGYWRKKYLQAKNTEQAAPSSQGSFLLLDSSTHSVQIIYPNGVQLQVPAGTPVTQLSALIRIY